MHANARRSPPAATDTSHPGACPRAHHSRNTLMLIGYVSDERYSALADVALEFVNDRGE
jgi:hypothetical protein